MTLSRLLVGVHACGTSDLFLRVQKFHSPYHLPLLLSLYHDLLQDRRTPRPIGDVRVGQGAMRLPIVVNGQAINGAVRNNGPNSVVPSLLVVNVRGVYAMFVRISSFRLLYVCVSHGVQALISRGR